MACILALAVGTGGCNTRRIATDLLGGCKRECRELRLFTGHNRRVDLFGLYVGCTQ